MIQHEDPADSKSPAQIPEQGLFRACPVRNRTVCGQAERELLSVNYPSTASFVSRVETFFDILGRRFSLASLFSGRVSPFRVWNGLVRHCKNRGLTEEYSAEIGWRRQIPDQGSFCANCETGIKVF